MSSGVATAILIMILLLVSPILMGTGYAAVADFFTAAITARNWHPARLNHSTGSQSEQM